MPMRVVSSSSSSTTMKQQARPQLYKQQRRRNAGTAKSWRALSLVVIVIVLVVALQVIVLTQTVKVTTATNTLAETPIKVPPVPGGIASAVVDPQQHPPTSNIIPPQTSSSSSSIHVSVNNTRSFLYNAESPDELMERLPPWIRDYVTWHAQMRRQYPGMELFTNPNAPKVLIRVCLGLCGGLHDRLGQLPWDLYLANATQRVLLMAWQRPRSLENFLIPNHIQLFDWRVPPEFQMGFDDMHRVRNFTGLFQGYAEDHPEQEFWKDHVDQALERATTGEFRDIKVLRHRILGHLGERELQARLNQVGATEDVHAAPHFGRIFWLFFRPSPPVQAWAEQIMRDTLPDTFTAVHCRVRHPKAFSYGKDMLGKNPKYPADKTGLPWEGETRQFALNVAKDALNCSRLVSSAKKSEESSVYFLSDSNDLVRHVAMELQNDDFVQANHSQIDQELYALLVRRPQQQKQQPSSRMPLRVVARDVSEETAHLDRQKGRQAPSYYATFVDLMVVVHARCVVYGIGYYAAFGAKISGTPCQYLYQQEAWGNQAAKVAQVCPNTIHSSIE